VNTVNNEIHIEIKLPRKLYENSIKKAEEAGFNNFNEFLIFILEQLTSEEEVSDKVFSKEEEEIVKERLRALGYIE